MCVVELVCPWLVDLSVQSCVQCWFTCGGESWLVIWSRGVWVTRTCNPPAAQRCDSSTETLAALFRRMISWSDGPEPHLHRLRLETIWINTDWHHWAELNQNYLPVFHCKAVWRDVYILIWTLKWLIKLKMKLVNDVHIYEIMLAELIKHELINELGLFYICIMDS